MLVRIQYNIFDWSGHLYWPSLVKVMVIYKECIIDHMVSTILDRGEISGT